MLEVILAKFIRAIPVLMVLISGFGLTYYMLLQYETVYGIYTPSTGVMYYPVIYFVFILTEIILTILITNLLIGKHVPRIFLHLYEIPLSRSGRG
jgi:hypothetical protein